jgi:hypothetical protein
MDSQSKNDLIFYGELALVLWLVMRAKAPRPLTWQVDPRTGNLVPAQQAVNPLLPLIQQATSQPLISPDIIVNSDQGSASLTWEIDPVTGLLRPPGSAPGASGSW